MGANPGSAFFAVFRQLSGKWPGHKTSRRRTKSPRSNHFQCGRRSPCVTGYRVYVPSEREQVSQGPIQKWGAAPCGRGGGHHHHHYFLAAPPRVNYNSPLVPLPAAIKKFLGRRAGAAQESFGRKDGANLGGANNFSPGRAVPYLYTEAVRSAKQERERVDAGGEPRLSEEKKKAVNVSCFLQYVLGIQCRK